MHHTLYNEFDKLLTFRYFCPVFRISQQLSKSLCCVFLCATVIPSSLRNFQKFAIDIDKMGKKLILFRSYHFQKFIIHFHSKFFFMTSSHQLNLCKNYYSQQIPLKSVFRLSNLYLLVMLVTMIRIITDISVSINIFSNYQYIQENKLSFTFPFNEFSNLLFFFS